MVDAVRNLVEPECLPIVNCAGGLSLRLNTSNRQTNQNGNERHYQPTHETSLSVSADQRIDGAVNHHDLPIVTRLLENQAVSAFHLIGALDHVVEACPTRGIPVSDPEIR